MTSTDKQGTARLRHELHMLGYASSFLSAGVHMPSAPKWPRCRCSSAGKRSRYRFALNRLLGYGICRRSNLRGQQHTADISMPVGVRVIQAQIVPACHCGSSHRLAVRPVNNTAHRHTTFGLVQRHRHVTRQQRSLTSQVVCAKARKPQADTAQSAQNLPQSREQAVCCLNCQQNAAGFAFIASMNL